MIVKEIRPKKNKKSDFKRLVQYMLDPQNKLERVGQVRIQHCHSMSTDWAVQEVLATQRTNTRARGDKTYHMMISFPPGEQPDAWVLQDIEQGICERLGFAEHQRISVVHHDTDHMHLHVAINKIHPKSFRMHEPFQSHRTMAAVARELEQKHHLTPTNHDFQKSRAENRARDFEEHRGEQSLINWIREHAIETFRVCSDWEALHRQAAEFGLKIQQRGNGLVFKSGELHVKCSSVARDFSKGELEGRFGSYIYYDTSDVIARSLYQKPPLPGLESRTLYDVFQKNRQHQREQNQLVRQHIGLERQRRLQQEYKKLQLKIKLIKQLRASKTAKKMLVKLARRKYRLASNFIRSDIKRKQEYLYRNQPASTRSWLDWLRDKAQSGSEEALSVLRKRETRLITQMNSITGLNNRQMKSEVSKHVTKHGTAIYTLGTATVRDTGDTLYVQKSISAQSLRKALELARTRYGNRLDIQGDTAFKTKVLQLVVQQKIPIQFSDTELEKRREEHLKILKQGEQDERRRQNQRSHGYAGGYARRGFGISKLPGTRSRGHQEPNALSYRSEPPPQRKNRLRELSKLGLVQLTAGFKMLLPSHVSRELEQQQSRTTHALRWEISGAGIALSNKFIAQKKLFLLGKRYRLLKEGTHNLCFMGIEPFDGKKLALFEKSGDLYIAEYSSSMANVNLPKKGEFVSLEVVMRSREIRR